MPRTMAECQKRSDKMSEHRSKYQRIMPEYVSDRIDGAVLECMTDLEEMSSRISDKITCQDICQIGCKVQ